MIRFHCPNCNRLYELSEALARLPLVCKGCGQPLAVPEKSTAPEPTPELPRLAPVIAPKPELPKPAPVVSTDPAPLPVLPKPAPVVAPTPEPAAPKPRPAPIPEPKSEPTVVATESRLPPPERPLGSDPFAPHPNGDGLFEQPDVLASLDVTVPIPPPPPIAPAPSGKGKLLGIVVDVVVALILVGIGVFCGELLARQSTSEVLRDAGSAAKFPPIDLLMWLAPTVLVLLVYGLLISRGKSVGGRIRRRADG